MIYAYSFGIGQREPKSMKPLRLCFKVKLSFLQISKSTTLRAEMYLIFTLNVEWVLLNILPWLSHCLEDDFSKDKCVWNAIMPLCL